MIWLPDKKELKARRRLRRLRWRRRIVRFLLFMFLFFGLGAASTPPQGALLVQVNRVTGPYQFDFIDWESRSVASELWRRVVPPELPPDYAGQRVLVDRYLGLERQIRAMEEEINELYTVGAEPDQAVIELAQKLDEVRAEQADLVPRVEALLSRQVEAVLEDEGFTIAGQVFPPVAFRFIDPPTGLVLSPRDRIEKQHFIGLQPGLDVSYRFEIEQALDKRGDVSSYVTNIGGLGSYPTMVINHTYLPYLIEVIAHEWTHNYLYTFPTNIAWGYQTYPKLTTINETTADIVGREVSYKVIARFYPDLNYLLPPLDGTGQPVLAEPSEFDLAMQSIRLEVDRLLVEKKVEEAEAFMEQERLKLVEQGYSLRKLNQAYFAFHSVYATSPTSVDPTGAQLRQLRAASPSLKSFLDDVGWFNSYEDFLNLLTSIGVET
jgi:hypothetical protein